MSLLQLFGCGLLATGAWLLMDDNAGRYVQQMTSHQPEEDQNLPMTVVSYSQVHKPIFSYFTIKCTGVTVI